jgi:hypothetical protein
MTKSTSILSDTQRKLLLLLEGGTQLVQIPGTSDEWVVVIARPSSDIDTRIDPLQVWKLRIEVLGKFSGWEIEPLRLLGYINDNNRITGEGIEILQDRSRPLHTVGYVLATLAVLSEHRRQGDHVDPKLWAYEECRLDLTTRAR